MDENFAMGYAMGQDNGNGNCNDGLFGGGSGGWLGILLLIALLGGGIGWGGGFGGFGGGAGLQGMATRADINEGFALNNITSGITAIQQGICDATYALNNAITSGFHGVDSGFCNLSRQLSDCCCENRAAIADLKYTAATESCATRNLIQSTTRDLMDNQNANTRAILDFLTNDKINTLTAENQALKFAASQASQNANTRAVLDFLTNDKISTLTAENQALKFAASQASQNAFITANQEAQTAELIRRLGRDCPVPAYVVPNPNCCYGNPVGVGYNGYTGGCGCNNFA